MTPRINAISEAAVRALDMAEQEGHGLAVATILRESGETVTWVVTVARAVGVTVTDGRTGTKIDMWRLT